MKKTLRILALLLAAAIITLSITACAAKSQSYDTSMAFSGAGDYNRETPMEAPQTQEMKAEEAEMVEYASDNDALAMTTEVTEDGAPEAASSDVASKIIYSADLSAQTTDFDTAIAALDKQIASFGGFIERSDIYGDTRYNDDGTTSVINRWAYYTIRVPAARFEQFLHQTEGLGNVISLSRYAENVTSRYTDYEARLSSLRTQEERLLSMLEKSEDVESLIALEQRLADVRSELESSERNLKNLDLQISYSTVTLSLQEVEVYTPTVPVQRTFGEKLSSAFSDGWKSFVRGLQYFVLDLAMMLPGLVLFVLIVAALVLIVKKTVRKVKAKRAAQKAASAPKPETNETSE